MFIYLPNTVPFIFNSIEEASSVRSFTLTSTSSTRYLHSIKSNENTLGNFLVRTPTKKEQPKFECLLLRMSVSNGFSFQWIDNQATLDLFEFLNPHLVLPERKALSNRILNTKTESLNKLQDDALSNDKIGI